MDPIFQRILDATSDGLHEGASALSGGPGTLYGEGMNRIMAGGRSLINGSKYDDELQRVKEGRAEQYPGAYSVIPQLRNKAIVNSYADALGSGLNPSHLGEVPLMAGMNKLESKLAQGAISDADLMRLPLEYRVPPGAPPFVTQAGRAKMRNFRNSPETQAMHDDTDLAIVRNALTTPGWHVGEDSSIPAAGVTMLRDISDTPEIALNVQKMEEMGYPAGAVRSVLTHELGERAGYHDTFPIANSEPGGSTVPDKGEPGVPFATHGTTLANTRQFEALSRDPESFGWLEQTKLHNPDSAIEREMVRKMREYGATPGHPMPSGGRQERTLREHLVQKFMGGGGSAQDVDAINRFASTEKTLRDHMRSVGATEQDLGRGFGLDPGLYDMTPAGQADALRTKGRQADISRLIDEMLKAGTE